MCYHLPKKRTTEPAEFGNSRASLPRLPAVLGFVLDHVLDHVLDYGQ